MLFPPVSVFGFQAFPLPGKKKDGRGNALIAQVHSALPSGVAAFWRVDI